MFLFLLLVNTLVVYGGDQTWQQRMERDELEIDNWIRVSDPVDYDEQDSLRRELRVSLAYHRGDRTDLATAGDWNMTVIFTAYYADSTESFTDTLLIEFAPGSSSHIYESVKWHARRDIGDVAYVVVDWVQIKYDIGSGLVTNNNPDWSIPQTIIPQDIHLTAALTTVRLGQLNIYAPPQTGHRIEGAGSETDLAVLYWKYVEGAEEYDLEFSWVDDKRSPAPSMAQVWSRATRIRTPQNHFDLPLAYASGTIYYRVRPVGVHYTGHRLEPRIGNWSAVASIAVNGTEVDPFEPTMSWQTQVQYAEDGKYKQLVTFYDRASRPRQVQTNLSTDSLVAVAETKYDREGREALSIIPVPLAQRNLRYKQSLNKVDGGGAIGFAAFDHAPGTTATALDSTTGSGEYYSSLNALGPVRHGLNLTYIPRSRYPFSETEYTQDGTGRIRRQSGVGEDHQIGASGHATRYYYGNPSSTHLHRLFGTQVGDAKHYQRNMVVDANGQASITYLDMYGRTIATSLVGDKPGNVQELARSTENIVVSLKVGDPIAALDDYVSRSENVILNEVPSSTYDFSYDLRGILASDATLDYCVDCQYALSIIVIGPDGVQLTSSKVSGVSSGTGTTVVTAAGELIDTFSLGSTPVCTLDDYSPGTIVFRVDLDEIGEYRVLKALALVMDPIDEAIPGLSTYPDWDSTAVANSVDTLDCSWTCYESCVIYVDYLLAEGEVTVGTEYDDALDDCVAENCTAVGVVEALADTLAAYECKALLDQIRIQVSPLGYLFEQDDWRDVVGAALATAYPGTYSGFGSLSYGGWVAAFDDDLRDLLVLIHPEYCHYEHCLATLDTKAFDYLIAMQADWSAAITSGYLNPLLGITTGNYAWSSHTLGSVQDPFGDTWSAAWVSLLTTAMTSFYTDAGYGLMNLWQFLDATTPPGSVTWDAATTIYAAWDDGGGISAGLQDSIEWQVFYGAYLGLKNQTRAIRLEDDAYGDCPYWEDENAIVKRPILDASPTAADSAMATLAGAACIGGCDDVVDYWLAQLNDCELTATQYTELGSILFAACMDNCDGSSPYPIISSLDSAAGVLAVLEAYLDTAGISASCDTAIWSVVVTPSSSLVYSDTLICFSQINACFSGLISYLNASVLPVGDVPPCSYHEDSSLVLSSLGCLSSNGDTSLIVGTSLELGALSGCQLSQLSCRLLDLYYYNDSVGGTGSIVQLAVEDVAEILDFHWQELSTLDHTSLILGDYTGTNIDATACSGECYTGYVARIKTVGDSVITVHMFGDNSCFTYTDGDSCKAIVTGFADPGDSTLTIVENDCLGEQVLEAITIAEFEYTGEVAAYEDSIRRDYRNQCFMNTPFREVFSYSYESTEHHFTLYYYDQAGNLVQTVPPAGVAPLSASNFVDTTGEYKTPYQEPDHRLQSSYAYDSRNMVSGQFSPDGGQSQFWYNDAGQLRYSQNAQQAEDEAFSFTCYDDLGRITVSGEVEDNAGDSISNGLANTWVWLNDNSYPPRDWSSSSPSYAFNDVVTTTYDGVDGGASIAQSHLRNRVSSTRVRQQSLSSSALVTSAAFYCYDAHGNVDTLERRIRGLGAKKVAYRYDLLSGNVHEVAYQGDSADAFYHRYRYDADNRLLSVRTSQNKVIWSRDAEYFYYPHGPLARVEIGEDRLQGMDYYYTIHGWLKGVNTVGTIGGDTVFDPGTDGYERIHRFVAGDELGYTLGYYKGDYDRIGRGSSTLTVNRQESKAARQIWDVSGGLGSDVLPAGTGAKGLYNGNIAVMLSEIAPSLNGTGAWASAPLNGMAYQYDQLHRIKKASDYQWNSGTNVWGTSSSAYETEYSYDPNGNISSLKRYGLSGSGAVLLDDLDYTYDTAVPADDGDNRLLFVDDFEGEVISGVDLADQSAGNYTYDAIGNLTKDVSAEIEDIFWTTQGKIESLERMASSTEKDLRFTYDAFGNRSIKQAYTHGSISDTTTYTTTFYVRDAQGNPLATYVRTPKVGSAGFDVDIEQPLYGSIRIGMRTVKSHDNTSVIDSSYHDTRVKVSYELSNHLTNVLVTLQDLKMVQAPGEYVTEVNSAMDFYPFGMIMPGRRMDLAEYRFRFQSQEQDSEMYGDNNAVSFKYRIHDPRVGRFMSIDPLTADYPWNSPYAFSENKLINHIELEGLEGVRNTEAPMLGGGGGMPPSNGPMPMRQIPRGPAPSPRAGPKPGGGGYQKVPNNQGVKLRVESIGPGQVPAVTPMPPQPAPPGIVNLALLPTDQTGTSEVPVRDPSTTLVDQLDPLEDPGVNERGEELYYLYRTSSSQKNTLDPTTYAPNLPYYGITKNPAIGPVGSNPWEVRYTAGEERAINLQIIAIGTRLEILGAESLILRLNTPVGAPSVRQSRSVDNMKIEIKDAAILGLGLSILRQQRPGFTVLDVHPPQAP